MRKGPSRTRFERGHEAGRRAHGAATLRGRALGDALPQHPGHDWIRKERIDAFFVEEAVGRAITLEDPFPIPLQALRSVAEVRCGTRHAMVR